LFGQTLPIKQDQDKVLDNSTKLLEYKKTLTAREEWQPRIPWAIAVDSPTGFSASCYDGSSGIGSMLAADGGLFG